MAAPEYNLQPSTILWLTLKFATLVWLSHQDQKINLNGSGWMPGNRVLMEGVELLHHRLHRLHALRLIPAAVLLLPAVAEG